MAVNFPSNPNNGDTYEAGNKFFRFDGTRWKYAVKLSDYSGDVTVDGTLTGAFAKTVGTITGSATLDLSTGNAFEYTPTANTTFVFNNPPAAGTVYEFDLKINGVSGISYTFPATVKWPNNTTPSMPGADDVKVFSFYTDTAGAEYIAYEKLFVAAPVIAITGGTESTYTANGKTYKQHVFTSSGSLQVTSPGTVEILVVGGGGGGGMLGGGGAGGGVVVASNTVSTGTYTVTVGDGGIGQVGWSSTAGEYSTQGENSSVFGVTAYGGGGGRSYRGGNDISNQGVANYGGLGYNTSSYASINASFAPNNLPSGWTGTVHAGFTGGAKSTSCCPCGGGGGAGAGENGTDNNSINDTTNKPDGGDGVIPTLNGVPMYNGQNFYFGGGGAADAYCNQTAGTPGLGGGGGGGDNSSGFESSGDTNGINPGGDGQPSGGWGGAGGTNTGGGGGSGCHGSGSVNVEGGAGGSGIVVVRYEI